MSVNNNYNLITMIVAFITSIGYILVSSMGSTVFQPNTSEAAKVNTFKNEALQAIASTEDMYINNSMVSSFAKEYLSGNDKYQVMCVTLNGLVENGYMVKDTTNFGGIVVVMVPYDGSRTLYHIWMHNGTFAVDGVEKELINRLKKEDLTNISEVKKIVSGIKHGDRITITSDTSKGGVGEEFNPICINDNIY